MSYNNIPLEYGRKTRNDIAVSVSVINFHIETVGELGKIEVENFGNGIVRIYNGIRRIEFKQYSKDENDGRVFGWAWDCVKNYAYQPRDKYAE